MNRRRVLVQPLCAPLMARIAFGMLRGSEDGGGVRIAVRWKIMPSERGNEEDGDEG
jgi:hypothetical protein